MRSIGSIDGVTTAADSALPATTSRTHVTVLLALTFATGIIDALSWLGLNGVFTANMTGNVLIIGMGAANAGGARWLPPLLSVACFMLGCALTGRLQMHEPPGWSHRTSALLMAVATTVLGLGIVTLIWPPHHFAASAYAVTAVLALAMGTQGTEAMRVAVPQLITVAVSSAVIGVGMSLFLGATRGAGVLRRALAIVLLALGALAGSLLAQVSFGVGLLVAGAVMAVVVALGHSVRTQR